jgi:cyclopropane fatty-acyl-phospholipid synthase-like methyltransferase
LFKVNPFELVLWTFRRNENDVVNLYNTLSPVMQLVTDDNMLNFGYWSKEVTTPIDAQNRLCNEISEIAELNSAKSLLDIGSGLSSPAIMWSSSHPNIDISCLNINYTQLKFAQKIVNKKTSNRTIHEINSTSTMLPFLTNSVERIIALESAQHFKPFSNFITESYRVLKKDGILTIAIPVVKKKSNMRNLGILALTWSSEHYSEQFVISEITKKFKSIKKIEIGTNVFEPLANYYFKNRKKLRNKILTKYTSYVENILFKSLLKMKKASDEGIIGYLIIKCMKCD